MADQLSELVLPAPFSLLPSEGKPAVYVRILAIVGCVVTGGVVVGAFRRFQRVSRQRGQQEHRIQKWLADREEERNDKINFLKQAGEGKKTDNYRLRVNVEEAFLLWKEGQALQCRNADSLKELLVDELVFELPRCLGNLHKDWLCERKLVGIVQWVKEMKIQDRFEKELWKTTLRVYSGLRRRNRWDLFTIMILSSQLRLVGLGLTSLVAFVSDRVETGVSDTYTQWMECFTVYAPHATVLKWATVNLLLCLTSSAITFAMDKVTNQLLNRFKQETDCKLYHTLASMDTAFFDTYGDKEINEIADLTSELLEADNRLHNNVKHMIRVVSKVVNLWKINVRLTFCLFGLCGLYSAVNVCVEYATKLSREDRYEVDPLERKKLNSAKGTPTPTEEPEISEAATALASHMDLYTVMQNIKVLRSFSCERDIIQALLYKQKNPSSEEDDSNRSLITTLVDCTGTWILSGIRLWGVWHAAWLVQKQLLDYPLSQLNNLVTQSFVAFQEFQLIDLWWIDQYAADAALLTQVLEYIPQIEKDEGITKSELQGRVEFREVHFAYPTAVDQPVLKGLSFEVEPGQKVGLVGHSGGGKSTTMQLLQRLYDPTTGQVLLDGIDLREYNPRWLRAQTAVVSQNVQLFDMSIEDNIRIANAAATREEVLTVAKQARAYDFIMRLPQGFSTRLSGSQLSGGQRQRIAIARALLMKAKVLLLDEATSALDSVVEKEVQAALLEMTKGKTCIMVTHRMATVRDADMIVVIHKGICVQKGHHDHLILEKGIYADLVHAGPVNTPASKAIKVGSRTTSIFSEPLSMSTTTSSLGEHGNKRGLTLDTKNIHAVTLAETTTELPLSPVSPGSTRAENLEFTIDEDSTRVLKRAHTVDSAILVGFSREVYANCRKLQELHIHTNHLEYNKEVRCAIEKIITGLQESVERMGKHVKHSRCAGGFCWNTPNAAIVSSNVTPTALTTGTTNPTTSDSIIQSFASNFPVSPRISLAAFRKFSFNSSQYSNVPMSPMADVSCPEFDGVL